DARIRSRRRSFVLGRLGVMWVGLAAADSTRTGMRLPRNLTAQPSLCDAQPYRDPTRGLGTTPRRLSRQPASLDVRGRGRGRGRGGGGGGGGGSLQSFSTAGSRR